MTYVLLWTLTLAFLLLSAATGLAVAACLRPSGARHLVSVLVVTGPVLLAALATISAADLHRESDVSPRWILPLAALTIAAGLGGFVLLRRAGRSSPPGDVSGLESARWPAGRLAVCAAIAGGLVALTYWNIDLAVGQELTLLRADVGAMALADAPPRVADQEDAGRLLRQASERMFPPDDGKGGGPREPIGWDRRFDSWTAGSAAFDARDSPLGQLLDAQGEALRLVRAATTLPRCRLGDSLDSDRRLHSRFWSYASRILDLRARARAANGDLPGAAADLAAQLVLADLVSESSFLLDLMVGLTVEARACASLTDVLAPASCEERALDDLSRVSWDVDYGRRFARVLRGEEAFGLSVLCDLAGGRWVDGASAGEGLPIVPGPLGVPSIYRVFFLADEVTSYRSHMRRYRDVVGEPFWKVRKRWDKLDGDTELPHGFAPRLVTVSLRGCGKKSASGTATRRLSGLLVALHRSRARSGAFPVTLEALVPDLLVVVPDDPFDGKPLRYRRTDGGCLVYSVGPDGLDDGGIVGRDDLGDLVLVVARKGS